MKEGQYLLRFVPKLYLTQVHSAALTRPPYHHLHEECLSGSDAKCLRYHGPRERHQPASQKL
ncbi:hypothetical protein E2C01_063023 [Portunus trituberculatus]|uniref:Uncharacterized protein n=1 Tax=Portunus trituberculatus TaxID=210409 RepID=A0A5B7HF99_PORTR|nr:hypothetical protein [Portunus trituberculatus]